MRLEPDFDWEKDPLFDTLAGLFRFWPGLVRLGLGRDRWRDGYPGQGRGAGQGDGEERGGSDDGCAAERVDEAGAPGRVRWSLGCVDRSKWHAHLSAEG